MFFDHLPKQGVICAHRGLRSLAPENTLLAMLKARDCGAHCLETDVRISKDGELLIFHDATLERTTDICSHDDFTNRTDYRVDQFTLSELRTLDAGSWFLTDDPFSTVASQKILYEDIESIGQQKIPLLQEVLEFTKKYSFPVNLELKMLDTAQDDATIVDRVIELLKETDTLDMVLLSSFQPKYLYRARELSKSVSIAVLAEEQHPENLVQYLKSFSASAYHPGVELYDKEILRQLLDAGFRVNCWTINDTKQAKEMLRRGAGVITDWPQQMIL